MSLRAVLRRIMPAPPARTKQPYCYLGGGRALALTHRGQMIYLDTRDHGITPHIAIHGTWETEVESVLGQLLRHGDRVAEVGANMGYHTLAMAEAVGTEGQVHSFEANPEVLPLLRATIAVNGFGERVTLHPVAALDTTGEVGFSSDPEHIGSGHLAAEDEAANYSRRVMVPAVTLDAELADLPSIELLRMDAEGSEPQVLRGAAGLIARSPGLRIVTEWSAPMMARRCDLGALIAWLDGELGFSFWRVAKGGALETVPAERLPDLPHGDLVMMREAP